jgi:hypothetical protein
MPLSSGGLCTLRIATCRNSAGVIKLLPRIIRMPFGGKVVDNFARGGLAAPIDINTKSIRARATRKDPIAGVVSVERHPDTQATFAIPYWSEAVALAKRAHQAFPSMAFVGWDISDGRADPARRQRRLGYEPDDADARHFNVGYAIHFVF